MSAIKAVRIGTSIKLPENSYKLLHDHNNSTGIPKWKIIHLALIEYFKKKRN